MKAILMVIVMVIGIGALIANAADDTVKYKYDELKEKSAVALKFEADKPEEGHGRWFTMTTNKFDPDTGEKKTIETPVKNDHVQTEIQNLKEQKTAAQAALVELNKKIAALELLEADMVKLMPVPK